MEYMKDPLIHHAIQFGLQNNRTSEHTFLDIDLDGICDVCGGHGMIAYCTTGYDDYEFWICKLCAASVVDVVESEEHCLWTKKAIPIGLDVG